MVVVGPTEMAGNHHQRVMFGCAAAETEQGCSLQVSLGVCRAHQKISKNKMKVGFYRLGDKL